MAKKIFKLDFVDIVMGAEATVIKEAYDARLKIDDLLDARESAYQKIAEIEEHVEEIVGVTGEFVFPAPPLPVAGIPRPGDSTKIKKVIKRTVPEAAQGIEDSSPVYEANETNDQLSEDVTQETEFNVDTSEENSAAVLMKPVEAADVISRDTTGENEIEVTNSTDIIEESSLGDNVVNNKDETGDDVSNNADGETQSEDSEIDTGQSGSIK